MSDNKTSEGIDVSLACAVCCTAFADPMYHFGPDGGFEAVRPDQPAERPRIRNPIVAFRMAIEGYEIRSLAGDFRWPMVACTMVAGTPCCEAHVSEIMRRAYPLR